MDTFGAVLGPLFALIYLAYYPANYRMLFLIAFLTGVLAITFTFLIIEKKKEQPEQKTKTHFLDFIIYWKISPDNYKKLVIGLLIFTLFNSSDVFLLLKIKEVGYNDTTVIGVYIFYNLIYALFSYPLGILADKIGMKKILVSGFLLFALTYIGMAYAESKLMFFSLFFLFGMYAAATEGIAKAWITNVCEKNKIATAIGTYTAFQSIATLFASTLAGFIWFQFGESLTFLISGVIAILVAIYILKEVRIAKTVIKQ